MNAKKAYLAPTVTVVSFVTEQGFAGSGSMTESLIDSETSIDMGGGSSSSSSSQGGFFNRNNNTEAAGSLF